MRVKQGNKPFLRFLEDSFAAAGLAEGDHDVARAYLSKVEGEECASLLEVFFDKIKAFPRHLETHFAAAAMAEGGHDMALELLEGEGPQKAGPSFGSFLSDIGLQGIRVQYGIATI